MDIIEVKNLTKTYKTFKKEPGLVGSIKGLFNRKYVEKIALNFISLTVKKGDFLGFAGPNGAGKTTMLKILSGILYPTNGTVFVNGHIPNKRSRSFLKDITFIAGNKTQLDWSLPPMDSYLLNKEIYNISNSSFRERVKVLSSLLNIRSVINRPVRELSLGERMKSELLAGLLHNPEIIFLDEPTIGLDINSQKNIWKFSRHLNHEEGKTIILTSHYVEDIKQLCNKIILINKGNIIFNDYLSVFLDHYNVKRKITFSVQENVDQSRLKDYFNVLNSVINVDGNTYSITISKEKVENTLHKIIDNFEIFNLRIEYEPIQDIIAEIFEKLNT